MTVTRQHPQQATPPMALNEHGAEPPKPARLTAVERARLALERAERKAAESAARKATHKQGYEHFRARCREAIRAYRKRDFDRAREMHQLASDYLPAIDSEGSA